MKNQQLIIEYWIEKAHQDLASARDDFSGKRLQNAVSAVYFACFHALAALLFKEGKTFKKHREVRSALHRDYIKTGKIETFWGKHYDWLFENRQKADYHPLVSFDPDQVHKVIEKSEEFVKKMEELVSSEPNTT
jgi:uncharacterized protein (UPF0332 family)